MESTEYSAVYIDHRVKVERWVRSSSSDASNDLISSPLVLPGEPESLGTDLHLLLEVCKQIYICHSATSLATQLAALTENATSSFTPVFALYGIDPSSDQTSRPSSHRWSRGSLNDSELIPPSPNSLQRGFPFSLQDNDAHGLHLLSTMCADLQVQEPPNLVIPIAVVPAVWSESVRLPLGSRDTARCLDAGAVDVLTTPLEKAKVHGLVIHAYRARKAARKEMSRFRAGKTQRKQSWVGVDDEKPYAYLREAMVSKLMKGICSPEEVVGDFQIRDFDVSAERAEYVMDQLPRWEFAAHEFTEDELSFAACEMLRHGFDVPGLEQWRLTPEELRTFLLACRGAYNSFVLYHNFRHAIDVMQSIFCVLLHIGALPSYGAVRAPATKSPIASLLTPFDSLTILISAIGHDVGHPGVNNVFLIKLNAPLAQLYNDSSVLEAFHCAAFSQILRRHWPSTFMEKQLRKLLISSILATDMGIHQTYMDRLSTLQQKFHENNKTVEGWNSQDIDTYKTLLCGLLIKCADISNVARPWDVAEKWTRILQEEFANQGEMERQVGLETALFGGPPELGNIYKLATGQIGFMSIFALPLFAGVADLLPQMTFTVDQIRANYRTWQQVADEEKAKQVRCLEAMPPDLQAPAPSTGNAQEAIYSSETSNTEPKQQHDVARDGDANAIFNEPRRLSFTSASRPARDENCGDDFLVTEDSAENPSHVEMPSRKSSSAVPADVASLAIGEAPRTGDDAANSEGSNTVDLGNTKDAASEKLGGLYPEGRDRSCRYANDCSPVGYGSCPSAGYQIDTRAHSVSTRSNTVRTSISPATNATSFLAADSGDDLRSHGGGDSVNSDNDLRNDGNRVHPPASANQTAVNRDRPSYDHSSHERIDTMGKNAVMTTVLGKEAVSPAQSTTAEKMENGNQNANNVASDNNNSAPRRLPKRRSRLRLAFWKRKSYFQPRQEVGNET